MAVDAGFQLSLVRTVAAGRVGRSGVIFNTDEDGMVRVWDAVTGAPLRVLLADYKRWSTQW